MNTFDEDTKKLKTLITNAKKSGKEAWEAGKILHDINDASLYIPKYKTFNDYTNKNFKISAETAKQYIKVFQQIPIDMITDKMLVTHLYTIADMEKELQKQLLQVLQVAEKSENHGDKELPYDGDVVLIFKQMLQSIKSKIPDSVAKKIFDSIKKSDEKNRKKRQKKNPLEIATSFEEISLVEKYQTVKNLFSHTPISEQGLVGLFCTIFHLIKDNEFIYNGSNACFNKIKYIRTEFPDAQIEIIKIQYRFFLHSNIALPGDPVKTPTDINIEFELNSFNYWRHKHQESGEKCDMIICWEIEDKPKEITMPPVLSIKEVLETGKITLHYS